MTFSKVFRFENKGKMAAAHALQKTISIGKFLVKRAINKAAKDFEQRLFIKADSGPSRPWSRRFSTAPSCARYTSWFL